MHIYNLNSFIHFTIYFISTRRTFLTIFLPLPAMHSLQLA